MPIKLCDILSICFVVEQMFYTQQVYFTSISLSEIMGFSKYRRWHCLAQGSNILAAGPKNKKIIA